MTSSVLKQTTTDVEIREARIADMVQLVRMTRALLNETWWGRLPWNFQDAEGERGFKWALAHPKLKLLVAVRPTGQLVGMLGGLVGAHPLALPAIGRRYEFVYEWLFWVEPTERGRTVAVQLWHDLERWARQQGACGALRSKQVDAGGRIATEAWQHVEDLYVKWWGDGRHTQ